VLALLNAGQVTSKTPPEYYCQFDIRYLGKWPLLVFWYVLELQSSH
jgi:hypothetical protein